MTTFFEYIVSTVVGRGITHGELTLISTDGTQRVYTGSLPGPRATVIVNEAAAARRTLAGGSLGMAEAYLDGEWDTPDLEAVLALGVANMPAERKTALMPRLALNRVWHALRDNNPLGSRKNIQYHYDLGNDFYRLWLDESMAYSSAVFESTDEDLTQAQIRKWDRLLDLLQLSADDHLLELGCGWGSFAIHAVRQTGCRVTGVTLSDEQHAWATDAVRREGLEGRIDIRLQDYRHIPEQFSAVASIEMFEAVGERWWPVFFRRLKELVPSGPAALQVITIDEPRFDDYKHNPDFIQRHVFPGGMLPSPQRFEAAASAEGLSVGQPSFFGLSYDATLADWGRRFEAAVPQVHGLGFDERFVRLWRYYLAYCRAGFSGGTIDVMQVRVQS